MSHDELFKELLQNFLGEFMALFFPREAAQLRFDTALFIEQETFTDFPEGNLRRADVVAEVQTLTGEAELILIHIEIQASRTPDVPFRMWEYYHLLRLRHRKPLFPVVLYLAPGAGGITTARYTEGILGRQFLQFDYAVIGLPDLTASDYENAANPLAVALSALMRSEASRVERKFRGLVTVAESLLDESRQLLLATVVDRYLPLSTSEADALDQRITDEKGTPEPMSIYTLIRDDAREEGMARGLTQGIEQGLLRGQREVLLRLLSVKFGDIPAAVAAKVNAAPPETLDALLVRVLTANTLDEMGLTQDEA